MTLRQPCPIYFIYLECFYCVARQATLIFFLLLFNAHVSQAFCIVAYSERVYHHHHHHHHIFIYPRIFRVAYAASISEHLPTQPWEYTHKDQTTTPGTTSPTLCEQWVGSLTSHRVILQTRVVRRGLRFIVLIYNHLQMSEQRHFLLSYLKTLSVGPAGVWTHDLPHGSPVLYQLSQPVGEFTLSGNDNKAKWKDLPPNTMRLQQGSAPLFIKALFTWREEDPRRRNYFSFGLHEEISVGMVNKWRRKRRKLSAFQQLNARPPPCAFFCLFVFVVVVVLFCFLTVSGTVKHGLLYLPLRSYFFQRER